MFVRQQSHGRPQSFHAHPTFVLSSQPSIDHLKRPSAPVSRRARLATWWLPVTLVLGFALLFALLFQDRLVPAPEVGVVVAAAIASETTAAKPSGRSAEPRMLFQASGWIEPDPFPVRAATLTNGIIDQVHVHEGDLVDAGQLLATLIDEDAALMRDAMAAELAMKEAEFEAHCIEVQTMMQKLAAEQAMREQAVAAVDEASDRVDRLARVPDTATTESERVAARAEKIRSEMDITIADARIREIAWDFSRIAFETLAHRSGLDLARTKLAEAELNHARTRIAAPMSGRIMRLFAMPGDKKMMMMDDMDSATIAMLYDPEKLQVRVDVPLPDAASLAIGQRARIRTSLLPDAVFEGEVTRIGGQADIQRNTLEAKVRIIAPDLRMRPEMICRVEFFEVEAPGDASESTARAPGGISVFVPASAVFDGTRVWVCDGESGRIAPRDVIASREVRDGWVRVESGIRPGEWIVDDPAAATLKPGQRVRPLLQP